MEQDINLIVNRKKIFLSAFVIIFFVFTIIHSIFYINRCNIVDKYGGRGFIHKRIYYSSNNYCLVGLNKERPEVSFYEGHLGKKPSFSYRFICRELFGDSIIRFFTEWGDVKLAFDSQVTIMGYYTSVIINLIIFLIILLFSKVKNNNYKIYLLSKYGFTLIIIFFIISSLVAYFINTFELW